jgi:hypothetical protein
MQLLAQTKTPDLRAAYGAWVPGEDGVAPPRLVPADRIDGMQQGVRLAIVVAVIASGLRLGWLFAR